MNSTPHFDAEDHPPYAPAEQSSVSRIPPPSHDETKKNRGYGNGISIAMALLGLGLLTILVVGCSGGSPVVLLILGGVIGVLLLHYITWGRLLSRTDSSSDDGPSQN